MNNQPPTVTEPDQEPVWPRMTDADVDELARLDAIKQHKRSYGAGTPHEL